MTLGRALQDLGRTADARSEFEYVLSIAPDNLAAIRGLAELDPVSVPVPVPVRSSDELSTGTRTGTGVRLEPLKRASKEPAPPPAAPARAEYSSRAERPDHAGRSDPDLSALDASLDGPGTASAADAERAAQIERLEIWLAKLEQEREGLRDDQE